MAAKYLIDYGIIGFLGLMSVVAIAIAIERSKFYKQIKLESYDTIELLELDLTKRLHIIATIGSNAPYVGLLGTVLGIMFTFYAMGHGSGVDVNSIMTGLALALKATAAGLLAAMPAIVLYNMLHRKVNELILAKEAELARKKL